MQHAHHFLWHQSDSSQRICIGRPNSQFHTLLWCFTTTVWKRAESSPWTLAAKEQAVASRQCTVSQFLVGEFLTKNNITASHPPHFSLILQVSYIDWPPLWLVVRVLGYRSGGPGSIPGTTGKKSSGSGTGSTQPREYNWRATW
jgi:hypothetical protein